MQELLYNIQNNKRKSIGNNFFHMGKLEIKDWYNLIERHDRKDGIKVTKSIEVYSKRFLLSEMKRPSFGEQRIHLRKDQEDLYFTIGITLVAT